MQCIPLVSTEEQTVSPTSILNIGITTTVYFTTKMVSLLLIVTGASKGLGKAIVESLCLDPKANSLERLQVVLVARSADKLEELGRQILQRHAQIKVYTLSLHDALPIDRKSVV